MVGELGWVLAGEPHEVRAAISAIQRGPVPVDGKVDLGDGVWCVKLRGDAPDELRQRVERKLGHPLEARLDCEVAHYALGRGYVVILIDGADDGLEAALDASHPSYREIVRPSAPGQPTRICLPTLSVADPMEVVNELRRDGYVVPRAYEVGGCSR